MSSLDFLEHTKRLGREQADYNKFLQHSRDCVIRDQIVSDLVGIIVAFRSFPNIGLKPWVFPLHRVHARTLSTTKFCLGFGVPEPVSEYFGEEALSSGFGGKLWSAQVRPEFYIVVEDSALYHLQGRIAVPLDFNVARYLALAPPAQQGLLADFIVEFLKTHEHEFLAKLGIV